MKNLIYDSYVQDKVGNLKQRFPNLTIDQSDAILTSMWRATVQMMRWKYCVAFYVHRNRMNGLRPLSQENKLVGLLAVCFKEEAFPKHLEQMAMATNNPQQPAAAPEQETPGPCPAV